MSSKSRIIYSQRQAWSELDTTTRLKVLKFLDKLAANHASPGLHIEPMTNAADRRARTGRVDVSLRAVLLRVDTLEQPTYVYIGTYPHDKAILLARRTRLEYHCMTGTTQVVYERFEEPEPSISGGSTMGRNGVASRPVVECPREDPAVRRSNPVASAQEIILSAHRELQFDEAILAAAIAAPDEDALIEVLSDAPPWQMEALLDLAAGYSLETVREKLGLRVVASVPDGASEEELLARGFSHPAARMQFAIAEGQPEEFRAAIESGNFAAWKTFLHPQQRRLVDGSWAGPFRVSGGAGTGKTIVLVHRAVALVHNNPSARVVATTFTKTLAEGLSIAVNSLDSGLKRAGSCGEAGILVEGIDSLVMSVMHKVSLQAERMGMAAIYGIAGPFMGGLVNETGANGIWGSAVRAVLSASDEDTEFVTPTFLQDEYQAVVLTQRITSEAEYLKAPRKGRGVALNRARRHAMWAGFAAYRAAARTMSAMSFAERAHVAAASLDAEAQLGSVRLADNVLVDEAQDLHEGHWRFLRALTAQGRDDLFVAEDAQQRIYGRPVVLGQLGIKIVGRSRRLNLNYRTTRQNLDFALRALRPLELVDSEGGPLSEEHATSARSGPEPRVISVSSEADEYREIASALKNWVAQGQALGEERHLGDVAVLAYSSVDVQRAQKALAVEEIPTRQHNDPERTDSPVVLTMHRSKGMEFRVVALPGLGSKGALANPRRTETGLSRTAEEATRRSLLYVAATRARDELIVTHVGELGPFLARKGSGASTT